MLGGVLAVALAGTAACSGGGGEAGTGDAAGQLVTMTPAGTGTLDEIAWALPFGEPTTLDPAKSGDYSPQTVGANLCEPLMRLNADFSVGQGLAAKAVWADERSLVLTLRQGVAFWDGAPMRAEDVAYSLRRQMDPATQGIYGAALVGVTGIEATGADQVTIRTDGPNQSLLKALATPFGAVVQEAYAKKAGAAYGTSAGGVMCTGPYKLSSWKSGDSITIERNDGYWDATAKPKIGRVVFRFITNSNTLTSALLSGDVDGTYELPPSSAKALGGGGGSVYLGPSTQNVLVVPANAQSPAADRRLLDALSLAVDRKALIKNSFGGAADELKSLAPPSTWAGDPAGIQLNTAYAALPGVPEPDLEQAKKVLAQVGAPARPLVTAIPAGDQRSLQIATFFQGAAKQIGVDLEIRQLQPTEMSSLFYDPAIRQSLDLVVTFGYVGAPDAAAYVADMVNPGALFNWMGYDNPTATQLLAKARTAADPVAAAQAYADAMASFTPTLPVVYLVAPYERMYLNKRISGAPASFAYMGMPWAAYLGATGSGG
ncbi:ABC transporter substrate-binding protein [Yinghuangia soli]|uniref:ABC transporter substrate-binding protein n=1 Tax=Yinghuangia soli TaxID=2908204 RepID=A0AA41QAI4_9ACTN|nr:ABC transporter substrate-binding protein [Yinghuangia soli]MCF2533217.1 ABC transporter substrate-binding protein [Yinghuangia soli]